MGLVETAAEDIVYFDPSAEWRITGLAAFGERMASIKGHIHAEHFEMLNPAVQAHGDVAVLTFNYRSWNGEAPDPVASSWNSTEAYVRTAAGWRLLQSHWSLTVPKLATD